MKLVEPLKINDKAHLEIDGCDTVTLAEKYGTPLYVLSLTMIENACNSYLNALKKSDVKGMVCFASKALSTTGIYKIVSDLGLGCDTVSEGELYTALRAGMNPDKICLHGNNKQKGELDMAINAKVHSIVIDNERELDYIESNSDCQNISIRVNPGVEAHTHQYIQTAKIDSKFGFSIYDGTALDIVKRASKLKHAKFKGIHCHIGSQILEVDAFKLAVRHMFEFISELKKINIKVEEINLGGGFGVKYTSADKPLDPEQYFTAILNEVKICSNEYGVDVPFVIIEPGRSIVGEAGITLYTAGNIKEIPNIKKYVAIDGGMFDNPRFALYQAEYTPIIANRCNDKPVEKVTISGKCCESGDIIVENAFLPKITTGDLIAILTTGAYNYSMASNYNRNLVPPMVLVKNGLSDYLVKPQSNEDLVRNDAIPYFLESEK